MAQIYNLYRAKGKSCPHNADASAVNVLHIMPFSKKCPWGILPGEHPTIKTVLARLWFKLITKGNFKIYYTANAEGNITSTSCILGPCFKFPFMTRQDKQIGPNFTYPAFRGKGLNSQINEYIIQTEPCLGYFYTLIRPKNTPSIRSIAKTSFTLIGKTRKKRLRRYILIQE